MTVSVVPCLFGSYQNVLNMLLFFFFTGLVLRSSFPNTTPSIAIPMKHSDPPSMWVGGIINNVFPSLIVRDDEEYVDMFLHHNFSIYKCMWHSSHADLEYRVLVFRDLIDWLGSYNTTLEGDVEDNDDWLAWQIAIYDAA